MYIHDYDGDGGSGGGRCGTMFSINNSKAEEIVRENWNTLNVLAKGYCENRILILGGQDNMCRIEPTLPFSIPPP